MSSFTDDPEVRITRDEVAGRTVYELLKAFEYRVGSYDNPLEIIRVPRGFKTDLMSIPRVLWFFFSISSHAHAAVVHDYLLSHGRKPAEADRIFREALGVLGMKNPLRAIYYGGVRLNSMIKQLLGIPING